MLLITIWVDVFILLHDNWFKFYSSICRRNL